MFTDTILYKIQVILTNVVTTRKSRKRLETRATMTTTNLFSIFSENNMRWNSWSSEFSIIWRISTLLGPSEQNIFSKHYVPLNVWNFWCHCWSTYETEFLSQDTQATGIAVTYKQLYHKITNTFSKMTNLSLIPRAKLRERPGANYQNNKIDVHRSTTK